MMLRILVVWFVPLSGRDFLVLQGESNMSEMLGISNPVSVTVQ